MYIAILIIIGCRIYDYMFINYFNELLILILLSIFILLYDEIYNLYRR
jgi:hypothetical protein